MDISIKANVGHVAAYTQTQTASTAASKKEQATSAQTLVWTQDEVIISAEARAAIEATDGTQQDAKVEQAEASGSTVTRPYADYDDPADYNKDGNVDVDEFITYAKDKLARIKDGTWVDDGRQKVMRARNMPVPPKRMDGESDESFQLRQIKYEVSYSWKTNLNSWLDHIEGWRMGESQRYLDEKATEWVTDLMENKPAHFREWLEQSVKVNVEYAGGFDVAIVPKGFTMDDYNQWMSKGILECL